MGLRRTDKFVSIINQQEGWEIGFIGKERWWTDTAIDHETGKLTNSALLAMTDAQLTALAFGTDGKSARTELYRMPYDQRKAAARDVEAGSKREGIHRAVFVLEFRRRKAMEEVQPKMTDDDVEKAMMVLAYEIGKTKERMAMGK